MGLIVIGNRVGATNRVNLFCKMGFALQIGIHWILILVAMVMSSKSTVPAMHYGFIQVCATPTVTSHVVISTPHQNGIYNPGDVITFTCTSGYGLIGVSLISCQDDGQWSNNVPTCTAVSCGVPPSLSNAYHTHTDYTYPNTVYYQCVDGYYHSGSGTPYKQCMDTGSWSVGIEPQCTVVSCGVPPSFSNAYHTNTDYIYPNTVYYQCVDGYYHSGSGTPYKQCMDTSSWSVGIEPQCLAVSCGVPPSFSNAYHTNTDYTYPNTVYYQCVDGYYHSGSGTPYKQCMDTSSWSVGIEPQCT
ncbi:CUB and sushi domain-containing protein 2-like, partial [Saccoglossus kowalevskii]